MNYYVPEYSSMKRLLAAVPDADKRLRKHCKGLKTLMDEIHETFPEAHYMLHNGDVVIKLYEFDDTDYADEFRATALKDYSGLTIRGICEYA